MHTMLRRGSALAVAFVMSGILFVSDPFVPDAGAQPARRWGRPSSGRTAYRARRPAPGSAIRAGSRHASRSGGTGRRRVGAAAAL